MAEQQFQTSVLRAIGDFARRLKAVEYNARKFKWGYPIQSGGGAVIRFEVLSAGPYLGDPALECDYVVAEVLSVSCGGGAGVSVGDEINVWDPSECHFNVPIEVLIGAHGTATKMVNDTDDVVDCLDDRLAEGTCRWEVQSLCCVEEIGS